MGPYVQKRQKEEEKTVQSTPWGCSRTAAGTASIHYQRSPLYPTLTLPPSLCFLVPMKHNRQRAPGPVERWGRDPGTGCFQPCARTHPHYKVTWSAGGMPPCLLPLAGTDWPGMCYSLMNRIDSTFSCCLPKWQATHLID